MIRFLPVLGLLACAPPDTDDMFNQILISAQTSDGISNAFVDEVNAATDSLHIALPDGEDTALTDAVLSQWQSGVDVSLVIDYDQRDDAGFASLIAAGVPVQLADAGLQYFEFSVNEDVIWQTDQILMTQAFVIADRTTMVSASSAGGMLQGTRVLLDARGEELIEDVLTEHTQLFGGADSTASTAFNSPQKSIADIRWVYPATSDSVVEMWLGPQERLTKRLIDAVYGARASIWVLTNDFANDGFTKALQDKAEWRDGNGNSFFDVRVVVGPNHGSASPTLSALLTDGTPDVLKRQVNDARVPTILLVDVGVAPNGTNPAPRGFILTHDLYRSSRVRPDDRRGPQDVNGDGSVEPDEIAIIGQINDQLIDGTLWVVDDWEELSPEMETLVDIFDDHWDRGTSL